MTLTVSLPHDDAATAETTFVVTSAGALPGDLQHETVLTHGVRLSWPAIGPRFWHSIAVETWNAETSAVISALFGEELTRHLNDVVRNLRATGNAEARVEIDRELLDQEAEDSPWSRLAAVETLNRWLDLPLDQSLLDAERALSQTQAALELTPDSLARTSLLAEALRRARRASGGVADYFTTLAAAGRLPPTILLQSLQRLAFGYTTLIAEIREPDTELSLVVKTWHQMSAATATGPPAATRSETTSEPSPAEDRAPVSRMQRCVRGAKKSFIDPRQVRARTLRLAADPAVREVNMNDIEVDGQAGVRIRIAAFPQQPESEVENGLLVRIFEPGSSEPLGYALLRMSDSADCPPGDAGYAERHYEGFVPLRGSRPQTVRADVYDIMSEELPATTDADERLMQVRRAMTFLREWRRLAADVRLSGARTSPRARLRAIVDLICPVEAADASADTPLWAEGPSPAHLRQITDMNETDLLGALRGEGPPPDHTGSVTDDKVWTILNSVTGPRDLLAAELAAAYESPPRPSST